MTRDGRQLPDFAAADDDGELACVAAFGIVSKEKKRGGLLCFCLFCLPFGFAFISICVLPVSSFLSHKSNGRTNTYARLANISFHSRKVKLPATGGFCSSSLCLGSSTSCSRQTPLHKKTTCRKSKDHDIQRVLCFCEKQ